MTSRRELLKTSALAVCGTALLPHLAFAVTPLPPALEAELKRLETASGGRLGVGIFNTADGKHMGYRADERFPMCSTFKLLLAACVLSRVDQNKDHLDRMITFTPTQVMEYSPITGKRTGAPGISLRELCEAAVTMSDNTAANLLLESIGGPPAYTSFVTSLGDPMTRLDRNEPTLNESLPGDPRDTTTPAFAVKDVHAVVLSNVLLPASRKQLTDWLIACKTGDKKIRAGVSAASKVGDKTGSNGHDTSNDVAIIWPPLAAPWLLSVYLTRSTLSVDAESDIIAAVAKAVSAHIEHAAFL